MIAPRKFTLSPGITNVTIAVLAPMLLLATPATHEVGMNWKTGFYDFDDGPEDVLKRGNRSRPGISFHNEMFFERNYHREEDIDAEQGFLGFWASIPLQGTPKDRQKTPSDDRERRGLFQVLADAGERTFAPAAPAHYRLRTKAARSNHLFKPKRDGGLLKKLCPKKNAESKKRSYRSSKPEKKRPGLLKRIFAPKKWKAERAARG